jgi:acyl-CoA synthetase (AMP-forming)/AMP-acid ligase II
MYLTQPLHKALRERPQTTATICGARRHSFAVFVDRVARLAAALRELGVQRGDRVGMMALNSDRYLEFFFGTWWAGAVVNPVNIRWNAKEVAYSLDDCDTRVLLVDDQFVPVAKSLKGLSTSLRTLVHAGDAATPEGMVGYESMLSAAAPAQDVFAAGEDVAAVMYTGGTTGLPKGVMLTHTNLYTNALCSVATMPRPEDSVGIQAAPMFHVGGFSLSMQLMLRLCPQVILPGFDELSMLEAIAREKGRETFLVPTMIKRLIEHPRFSEFDVSTLNLIIYGAAPIDATLLDDALRSLPAAQFCQAYGMTELSPVVAVLPPAAHRAVDGKRDKLRSAGRPVPIAEIRIVDENDAEVPNGTVGEIVARGPMVMRGYWNKPDQTAQALRNGWMHTGDGGYMDDDGYIYVVDRIKDMIVTGGENVYSAEVENAILKMPQVAMCAVVGVPDDRWGERVHAVIVTRPGQSLDADAVIAHCRDEIAGYKCPRSVEFRDELPLSAAGKLQKFVLREPFWKGRTRRVN